MPESVLIYDVETERPVLKKGEKKWPDIAYAHSFEDYANLGISCVCCFDFQERRFRVFDKHSLNKFRALMRRRQYVIGYNNHGFDDPLLTHHGCPVDQQTSRDIMKLFERRVSLDKVAKANNVACNSGGIMAPIRWQQGRYAEVIDYCLQDVYITATLYKKYKSKDLLDPTCGELVNASLLKPSHG